MELFTEHSYAKAREDDGSCMEIPMETSTPVANADDIIVNVTQLDKNQDTFESLLLQLLKSHSSSSHDTSGGAKIHPDSLKSLSREQIGSIEASGQENCDTIRNLLKIKSTEILSPVRDRAIDSMVVSEIPNHSPSPALSTEGGGVNGPVNQSSLSSSTGSTISSISSSSSRSSDLNKNVMGGASEPAIGSPLVAISSPSAKSPSISIKISPEQLKMLQAQMAELLKQQNVIPEDISPEQKQAVLNSIITQQLNATLLQLIPGNNATAGGQVGGNQPRQQQQQGVVAPVTSKAQQVGVAVGGANTPSGQSSSAPLKSVPMSASDSSNKMGSSSQPSATSDRGKDQKSEESVSKKKENDSKRPPTAFNLFFKEMYPVVQEQQPNISFSDASKMVSGLWSGLGQDGKKKYYDKCQQIRNTFNARVKETPPVKNQNVTQPENSKPEDSGSSLKSPPLTPVRKKPKTSLREKEEGMCLQDGCYNQAVPDDNRGTDYCSNECIINHCKIVFHNWVSQRRLKT